MTISEAYMVLVFFPQVTGKLTTIIIESIALLETSNLTGSGLITIPIGKFLDAILFLLISVLKYRPRHFDLLLSHDLSRYLPL